MGIETASANSFGREGMGINKGLRNRVIILAG